MPRSSSYNTRARKQILQFLMDNREHAVTAASIQAHLEAEGGECPSAATIYRFLDKLAADGQVMRYVADKGEKAIYQYVGDTGHCREHLHLKCVVCGKIYHMDCGFMDEVTEHLMRRHGFALQCEGSILYGICSKCRTCAGEMPKVPFPVDNVKLQ